MLWWVNLETGTRVRKLLLLTRQELSSEEGSGGVGGKGGVEWQGGTLASPSSSASAPLFLRPPQGPTSEQRGEAEFTIFIGPPG